MDYENTQQTGIKATEYNTDKQTDGQRLCYTFVSAHSFAGDRQEAGYQENQGVERGWVGLHPGPQGSLSLVCPQWSADVTSCLLQHNNNNITSTHN